MKHIFLFFFVIIFNFYSSGQELNVTFNVNTPKRQVVDEKVFRTMEATIRDFMNDQQWTEDEFEPEERIEVTFQLTIKDEFGPTSFDADLQIQAVRPIYGSTEKTPLFTHVDKDVKISYEQYQPFDYSKNVFTDNLSSILSFYAYIILGIDYDSFSPLGGEKYYLLAQDVVNNVPSGIAADVEGWRSIEGNRNRYWLVENFLSPRVTPLRRSLYEYHLQGLDVMHMDIATGKGAIKHALVQIGNVNKAYPNSMVVQMFCDTKRSEIIEIFKPSGMQEKNTIIQTMSKMDPSNAGKYRTMR